MAALAGFLISLFTRIFAFFAARAGIKFSIRMAVAAAWLGACAVFLIAVGAIQGTLYAAVPGWVQDALDLLPGNTTACIAAIAATYAAAWTYSEITTLITIKGKV